MSTLSKGELFELLDAGYLEEEHISTFETAARADERAKVLLAIERHIGSDDYDMHSDSLIELLYRLKTPQPEGRST